MPDVRGYAMKNGIALGIVLAVGAAVAEPENVGGSYPSLAYYNEEGECGTGAVVPWAAMRTRSVTGTRFRSMRRCSIRSASSQSGNRRRNEHSMRD